MNKKEKACDKDYITFCMKANNNFRAEFNMATYELFKDKLFTTIDSMSSDQSTLLKYTVGSLDDALVGCISIFIDLTELAQLRNVEGEI
jgi:hypothetical protein